MTAYFRSDGELIELLVKDEQDQNCIGLINGFAGCESQYRGLQTHQFPLNSSSPWVGFHGQKQGDKITALGLVLFKSDSAKCKPYSEEFIN